MTIKERFRSAIRRGTGEAWLILKDNPQIDFSKEILKAAVTNFAYDAQCEGSRARYILDLIVLSPQRENIIDKILHALLHQKEYSWGLHQMFDIAKILASEGNENARHILYKRFELNLKRGYEYCGDNAIIELDGIDGLKKVAELRGKMLAIDPEDWEDNSTVLFFQKENPAINVKTRLENAAKTNSYVRHYLDAIAINNNLRSSVTKPNVSYLAIRERIENNTRPAIAMSQVKNIKRSDLKKLAGDFLKETDKEKQVMYLRLFSKTKFPSTYGPILSILKNAKKNKDSSLIDGCIAALKYFAGDDIRAYAIEMLKKTTGPYIYLDLLVPNYRSGDHKLMQSIADRYKAEHIIHSIALASISIYSSNKTRECKLPLETVYSKLNCGHCRYEIVKIMIENKVISGKIKKEMRFDCNEDIRLLAKGSE